MLSYLGKTSGAYTACKYWKVALDHWTTNDTRKLQLLQALKEQRPEDGRGENKAAEVASS
jgi:hypothetical protein